MARRMDRQRWIGALLGLAMGGFGWAAEGRAQSDLEGLIHSVQPRLVKVFGASAGRVQGYATGLVISGEGHILTISGVFLDGQQVRVIAHDGEAFLASVLRRDRERQLALLKVEAETPDHFRLAEARIGDKGDWVVAIGNAFKVADKTEPLSATLGVVSLRTQLEAMLNDRDVAYRGDLILIDAITSNPGAGGGAVVSLRGELVGMIGKIINSSETNTRLNYAVPVDVLYQFWKDELPERDATDDRPTGKAELGIRLFVQGGRNAPAYIDRVVRRSPAARARLQADDLVISLNGESVGTVDQYEAALDQLVVGEEVVIVVKRGTELLRRSITPEERK